MQVISEGTAPFLAVDPDGHREWVRTYKQRGLASKLMTEQEAVSRFVSDGDYLVYDCNYLMRGPASLIREIIRQGRRDLWLAGKFTYVDVGILAAAGCISKVDVGYFTYSAPVDQAVQAGRLQLFEYSNVELTLRLRAGAEGLPFAAVRGFAGTDGFHRSGAKLVVDPFTNEPITLLPALNPDAAIIHAHQADEYGNARIFGTGIAHMETALASKKVIISAEEIVSTEEIRRDPGRTSIPFYAVDAVVHAPFGAYPGSCAGYYASDRDHTLELFGAARNADVMRAYIEKWVRSVGSHEEMLRERVGEERLEELRSRETITEGYRP